MEGVKTSQVHAKRGSKMLGGLLLLALMNMSAADTDGSGEYCLKFETKDQGHILVKVKIDGADEVKEADGPHPLDSVPVDKCWENKIEYVMVQGPETNKWAGYVSYSSTGKDGNYEKNMKCETCDGLKTVSKWLVVEKDNDHGVELDAASICAGGGQVKDCKLEPPQTIEAPTTTEAPMTTEAPTTTKAATTNVTTSPQKALVSSVIRPWGPVASLSALVAHILF